MKLPEVIYYTDELNDEFSKGGIKARTIDGSYRYEGTKLRPAARAVIYHILAKPVLGAYLKLAFSHKVIGKEKLRPYRHKAYFMYGNHTNAVADAIIPTIINITGSTYVIVHPDNVSMPVLGAVTPALGAIPLPEGTAAYRNFSRYIKYLIEKGRNIMIYPEAHIWPWYTGIRPFRDVSFHYPVNTDTPVFCLTNTYQKRRFFRTPRIVTYIEGPFFPDKELPRGARIRSLRDTIYNAMKKNAAHSNVEMIKYIKKTEA